MSKEDILNYFSLLDRYMVNNKVLFDNEELSLINRVNSIVNKDRELTILFNGLRNTSLENREKLINDYYATKEKKPKNNLEEIANTFGIDVSKIEHKILDSGVEIFCFYDSSLGKNVILENRSDGKSLVEVLKEVQEGNKKYQGSDSVKNSSDILSDKRVKENVELKMLSIDEVDKNLGQVKGLTGEDYKKLAVLIRNSTELGISYINIENMVGLSNYGKIYEVSKDSVGNYKVGEPKAANYNEQNIDTSERIENNESLANSYEDVPNVVEVEFEGLSEDIKKKTIMFYENPDLLESLSPEERMMWKRNVEVYEKYLVFVEASRKNDKPKVKRLEKVDNSGFVNMFVIGMIMEFISLGLIVYCFLRSIL